jgi:hypothetical protein
MVNGGVARSKSESSFPNFHSSRQIHGLQCLPHELYKHQITALSQITGMEEMGRQVQALNAFPDSFVS